MKKYSQTQLDVAYRLVKDQGVSLRAAASLHGVPKSTLRDRITGRISLDAQYGKATFTSAHERKMVDALELASRIGHSFTKLEMLSWASDYAVHLGKREKGVALGQYWLGTFLTRWPDISFLTEPQPSLGKAVDEYYRELADMIKKYNCTSREVYIISEKEVCMDDPFPYVLNAWSVRSSPFAKRQRSITLVAAANTSGESVPPFLVVPFKSEGDTVLEKPTPDTGLVLSEMGTSSAESMKAYITNHLAKHIKPPDGSHVLLLYDSPKCPLPLEVQEIALELGFVMYYVTPPVVDAPVDADFLPPLVATIKDNCLSLVQEQPECSFNTNTMCQLLCKSYLEALTLLNIEQAFQNIGIFEAIS